MRDRTGPVVRLVGTLDRQTAGAVREDLLTCLADRAEPVAVDVSAVRIADIVAVRVASDVAATVEHWPAGGFVITAPPAGTGRLWSATGVTVVAGQRVAGYELVPASPSGGTLPDGEATSAPLGLDLLPVAGAARRARELVTDGCARWDVPHLTGPACVAITEMVNNVVVHAGTAMSVRVAYRNGTLRLSVRDGSADLPRLRGPVPPTALGGRGMLLVDAVARRWGGTPISGGKLTWATIEATDDRRGGV
ncbi:hypothetical protein O7632_26655 [Solwaraspora sp. WMMD406]|uniref:hypothetical protein n=1 Tax=Solwaraspora sp. WMMD406 TaxID=3016095 RepID=UPI002415BFB3|nr:hypothetical protein [Solwaraspora sp. WMMD406]MDG4767646.1 hypothetical protein [Solwaraspora sp. WMMD406]